MLGQLSFRHIDFGRLAWLFEPQGLAYGAPLGLLSVQVVIGLMVQAAHKDGSYGFSPSSSVTISEFLKFLLSAFFFYRECRTRHANQQRPGHSLLVTSERYSSEETKPLADDETNGHENGNGNGNGRASPPPFARSYKTTSDLDFSTYLEYVKNETGIEIRYGFAQLALFYALINNTTLVSYKLADPGAIQLTRSAMTIITALVMTYAVDVTITKTQWIAIIIQMCGLMVTQFKPGTGAKYPYSTYFILLSQVCLSASAGVYNMTLLKRENASLHANNMILYASGVAINLIIYVTLAALKTNEPGFFVGYGNIGAIMTILSNVFVGLAITAVYKYADAVIKCFATAVATGILLFLSPLLFRTDLGFLVLPGTIVVFIASYLYMESSGPKAIAPVVNAPMDLHDLSFLGKLVAVSRLRHKTVLGAGTFFTACLIALLAKADSKLPEFESNVEYSTSTLQSPFRNTLGMIRWNSNHPERLPLLQKYSPFFHSLHYSMPDHTPLPEFDADGHHNKDHVPNAAISQNLTYDTWPAAELVYLQIAKTMRLILETPKSDPSGASEIDGLLYFHFDAWLDPMAYSDANMDNMWFPDVVDRNPPRGGGPQYECMIEASRYPWWGFDEGPNFQAAATAAASVVDNFQMDFVVNPAEFCIGWTDLYYIPRRFFKDYIFLAEIFGGFETFHEVAVPTIVHIIDESRRRHPFVPVTDRFGDCWGSCCDGNPSDTDVLWHRCGHRLDYLNDAVIAAHYTRLENEAKAIGEPLRKVRGDVRKEAPPSGGFTKEALTAIQQGVDEKGDLKYLEALSETEREAVKKELLRIEELKAFWGGG